MFIILQARPTFLVLFLEINFHLNEIISFVKKLFCFKGPDSVDRNGLFKIPSVQQIPISKTCGLKVSLSDTSSQTELSHITTIGQLPLSTSNNFNPRRNITITDNENLLFRSDSNISSTSSQSTQAGKKNFSMVDFILKNCWKLYCKNYAIFLNVNEFHHFLATDQTIEKTLGQIFIEKLLH